MAIDILNIQPSVISRDLKGKYVLIYGAPESLGIHFKKCLNCSKKLEA